MTAAIINHLLELWPIICLAGDSPVNVLSYHGVAMLSGVIIADLELPFYALLSLRMRRETGVYHNIHTLPSLLWLWPDPATIAHHVTVFEAGEVYHILDLRHKLLEFIKGKAVFLPALILECAECTAEV